MNMKAVEGNLAIDTISSLEIIPWDDCFFMEDKEL